MDLEELRALLELRLGVCDIDDSDIVYTEIALRDGFRGKIKLLCMGSTEVLGDTCLTAEEAKESAVSKAISFFQGQEGQDMVENLPAPAQAGPRLPGQRQVESYLGKWEAAQAALRTLVGREVSAPDDFDWQMEEYDAGFQATLILSCLGDVVFDSELADTSGEAQESAAAMALEYCNEQLGATGRETEQLASDKFESSSTTPSEEVTSELQRKRVKTNDGSAHAVRPVAPRQVPPPFRPNIKGVGKHKSTFSAYPKQPQVAPPLAPSRPNLAPRRALPPRFGTAGGVTGGTASSSVQSVDEGKRRIPPPFRKQQGEDREEYAAPLQQAPPPRQLASVRPTRPTLIRPKQPARVFETNAWKAEKSAETHAWKAEKNAETQAWKAEKNAEKHAWKAEKNTGKTVALSTGQQISLAPPRGTEQEEEKAAQGSGQDSVFEDNTYDVDKAPSLYEAELMVGESADECEAAFHYLLENHDPDSTGITTVWAVRNLIVACNTKVENVGQLEDLCGRLRNMRWFGDNSQKVVWQKSKNRIQLSKLNAKDPGLIAKWEAIRGRKEKQGRYTR